ncbi:hypothetical protein ACTQ33_15155 [Candidatus Avoscillospira sp. LCP25S3_F1]|uniref:hypothetical protein n=1 Tax=Candidatus Avoscillospira sp. LCP25S3_F1 TaxID=3438825 RepID=UPI003F8EC833
MELLEYMVAQAGCGYLSALRFLPVRQRRFCFLKKVKLDAFPKEEWIEAARYICQQKVNTAAEAKTILMQR